MLMASVREMLRERSLISRSSCFSRAPYCTKKIVASSRVVPIISTRWLAEVYFQRLRRRLNSSEVSSLPLFKRSRIVRLSNIGLMETLIGLTYQGSNALQIQPEGKQRGTGRRDCFPETYLLKIFRLSIFFLFFKFLMSTGDQREQQWRSGTHYKISVRRGKELLKKVPRYITKPQQEQSSPNQQTPLVSSKVLRYPPNYDPYRYCFGEQEEEQSLFCGCIQAKKFKECQIYIGSNQVVTRKDLLRESSCLHCHAE